MKTLSSLLLVGFIWLSFDSFFSFVFSCYILSCSSTLQHFSRESKMFPWFSMYTRKRKKNESKIPESSREKLWSVVNSSNVWNQREKMSRRLNSATFLVLLLDAELVSLLNVHIRFFERSVYVETFHGNNKTIHPLGESFPPQILKYKNSQFTMK